MLRHESSENENVTSIAAGEIGDGAEEEIER